MAQSQGRRLERVGSYAALLMLGLLAAASLLLARLASLPLQSPAPSKPGELAAEARAVVLITTSKDGSPRARLVTTRLAMRQDDQIDLEGPELLLSSQDGAPPMRLTARSGRLSPDQTVLELTDEVRLERSRSPGATALVVLTDRLTIRLQEGQAETDAAVVATEEGRRLTGVGMLLDERSGRLLLRSNARLELPASRR